MLVVSKAATLVLAPEAMPVSAWTPFAYLWQDALTVLAFWLIDRALLPPAGAWILYALVSIYAAINVPIAAVLSTPLTVGMIRATGGALADSIAHHVNVRNVAGLCVPLTAAVMVPLALSRTRFRVRRSWVAALAVVAALGPIASARIDTRLRHRNVFGALAASMIPRVGSGGTTADWRATPFGSGDGDDLSRLKGIAARRNVIVVVLESTASRYLRAWGAADDPMPTLTALARKAIVADRAYVVYPESVKGLVHDALLPLHGAR